MPRAPVTHGDRVASDAGRFDPQRPDCAWAGSTLGLIRGTRVAVRHHGTARATKRRQPGGRPDAIDDRADRDCRLLRPRQADRGNRLLRLSHRENDGPRHRTRWRRRSTGRRAFRGRSVAPGRRSSRTGSISRRRSPATAKATPRALERFGIMPPVPTLYPDTTRASGAAPVRWLFDHYDGSRELHGLKENRRQAVDH